MTLILTNIIQDMILNNIQIDLVGFRRTFVGCRIRRIRLA